MDFWERNSDSDIQHELEGWRTIPSTSIDQIAHDGYSQTHWDNYSDSFARKSVTIITSWKTVVKHQESWTGTCRIKRA
jgi:hypothetical protein